MGVIAQPFGYLLRVLYEFFGSYGWALIVFTVIVNIIMLPLTIKQNKSTANMQKIQPKIAEIQKKYANDKEKQSQELMKVYQDNGINPMGGCLPLLIQLPIITILYQVIIKPLTYMYGLSSELITKLQTLVGFGADEVVQQINIAEKITPEILKMPEFSHLSTFDLNFYGLNLGATPSFTPSLLWIIPILAAVTSYLLTKVTQAQMAQPAEGAASSINTMNKIMPLISAWFTFSFPAGIGFYWVTTNVVRMAQQFFINLYFKKKNADPLVLEPQQPKEQKPNLNNVAGNQKKKKKGKK